jgi:hypothetical protein
MTVAASGSLEPELDRRSDVMTYLAAGDRYDRMDYRRCGASGLKLPGVSLGLWQNFGHDRPLDTSRAIVRRAFDLGITHFDLANNYGPPYGSAEENFGRDQPLGGVEPRMTQSRPRTCCVMQHRRSSFSG